MYELGGAKQAGSTYAHGGPAGKRGKSLREGRKNTPAPLCMVYDGAWWMADRWTGRQAASGSTSARLHDYSITPAN